MGTKPPVRQDAFESSGAGDVLPEVQAQYEAGKRRKADAEKKARKLARPKQTYDLPLAMIEAVKELADQEDVPQSDIAALALADFLSRYQQGKVDLSRYKVPARSLKFAFHLQLPGNWE